MSQQIMVRRLTTRLERSLRLLATTATVGAVEPERLQVIFEATPVPDAEMMEILLQSELRILRAYGFKVSMFGREVGAIAPAWRRDLCLG